MLILIEFFKVNYIFCDNSFVMDMDRKYKLRDKLNFSMNKL